MNQAGVMGDWVSKEEAPLGVCPPGQSKPRMAPEAKTVR